MSQLLLERDALIYHEMLAHTPLFIHRNPQKVALLGDNNGYISQEILKHPSVLTLWHIGISENNASAEARNRHFQGSINDFLLQTEKETLDILIIGSSSAEINFSNAMRALRHDGILIQSCEPAFDLAVLKKNYQQLQAAGFEDILPLNFPQPHFGPSWRSAVIAIKEGTIKRPREKDIFNKKFTTNYYNLDMHRAAFALPEFMREELAL